MPPKGRAVGAGAAASGAAGGANALPAKERALFTRLIQEYETKKYRLGLKTADLILKKHPDHGETLCMKGLILASLGDRPQGLELARLGVRKDLTSFISWHALGILNRMDKNYGEAIKCYSQALRIEGGTNINLIRESNYMHMQSRNYQPLIEGRIQLTRMQPHIRTSWAALAAAYHLAGRLDEAVTVLEQWETACRDIPPRNYEHSEMLLYHATILFEAERYEDVAAYLSATTTSSHIVDKRAQRILEGKAFLKLGRFEAAEAQWRSLIEDNEEDRTFVAHWIQSKLELKSAPAEGEKVVETLEALRELASLFPKSRTTQRMQLMYLSGNEFKSALMVYLSKALTKGVPSIFADLKTLLGDPTKSQSIETTALSLLEQYAPSGSDDEPPSSYLWTLFFLAQLYSTRLQDQTALAYIDSAILHTPTLPELHMVRARILKRAGAYQAASDAMEDARLLDGQDRFLNSKDAKYKLRIQQTEEAEKVMGLFTKPDAATPIADLLEMQAVWYVLKDGLSHERSGQLNFALKRYAQTEKVYNDHWDDQLDFHSYCVRKFTLRDYAAMCRWMDGLRGSKPFVQALWRSIEIYFAVYDSPPLSGRANGAGETEGAEGQANGLTDSQKKKLEQKRRKAEAKKREEEEAEKKRRVAEAAAKAKANKGTADEEESIPPPPDPDPDGTKLLQAETPLAEVERLVRVLQVNAPTDPRTWIATFELALREKNWLLAAKAVRKSADLLAANGNNLSRFLVASLKGRNHVQLLQLLKHMPDLSGAPEPVKVGIETALSSQAPTDNTHTTLSRLNDEYLQRSDDALAFSRALLVLDPQPSKETIQAILSTTINSLKNPKTTLDEAEALWSFLTASPRTMQAAPLFPTTSVTELELQEVRLQASNRFPFAEMFQSQESLLKATEERQERRKTWEALKEGELE